MNLKWNKPKQLPLVEQGTENLYWVAVESKDKDGNPKIYTFLAYYQNRPLHTDDNEDVREDCLVDTCGDPVESIGWVDCKAHCEFDDFYEPLDFTESYKLLGWAEYTPPVFTQE